VNKNALILVQAGDELVGYPSGGELMGRRQPLGMPLELLDVKQLGPQRLLFLGRQSVGIVGLVPGNQASQFFRDDRDIRQDLSVCLGSCAVWEMAVKPSVRSRGVKADSIDLGS
jgi:hypothetical protein